MRRPTRAVAGAAAAAFSHYHRVVWRWRGPTPLIYRGRTEGWLTVAALEPGQVMGQLASEEADASGNA